MVLFLLGIYTGVECLGHMLTLQSTFIHLPPLSEISTELKLSFNPKYRRLSTATSLMLYGGETRHGKARNLPLVMTQ